MKKFSLGILTVFVLLLSLTMTAVAADRNEDLGTVEYNGTKLVSSDMSALNKVLSEMEPGESAEFTVTLKNSGDKDMDFWMSNDVINYFEENGKASGGAYTYILRYNGSDLYNNQQVGGDKKDDGRQGLQEATGALENFFFLQTLSKGQSGTVTLYVALDGQTLGNTYQAASSKINLIFAVEEHGNEATVIKTGDTTNALPFFIGAGVAGLAILALVVIRVRKSRKGGERA